jgi:RNA polymerase sigma-70 factor (ECF subfamily)
VPVVGASKVARLLSKIPPSVSLHPAQVNGQPALVVRLDGMLDTVIGVRVDDGLITELYAVRNPEKLSHMDRETALRR